MKLFQLVLALILLSSCKMRNDQRFFTREKFENEFSYSATKEALERIKKDTSIKNEFMVFSFYYITDERNKIDSLIDYLEENEKNQAIIELNKINDIWELNGRTYPIKLELDSILKWEEKMWQVGYKFDCILDAWETTTSAN